MYLSLLLALACSSTSLHPAGGDLMPGESHWAGHFTLAGGARLPCDLTVTARQNGWLEVNGLHIRVVDGYDDTTLFLPHMSLFGCIPGPEDGTGILLNAGLLALTDEKTDDVHRIIPFLRFYSLEAHDKPKLLRAFPDQVEHSSKEYWEP